jgi:hypothetical protein
VPVAEPKSEPAVANDVPPSEDAARKARHKERKKAKDEEKKPSGFRAALRKIFG